MILGKGVTGYIHRVLVQRLARNGVVTHVSASNSEDVSTTPVRGRVARVTGRSTRSSPSFGCRK